MARRGEIFIKRLPGILWKGLIPFILVLHFSAFMSQAEEPSPGSYFIKGNEFFDSLQLEKSIDYYTKVIDLDPSHDKAYYNRGLAYKKLGQNDPAIKDFTKVIELNPHYLPVYIQRGNLYFDQGKYSRAVEDYSKSLEIDPNCFRALYNRGLAYKNMDNNQAACRDFKVLCKKSYRDACEIAESLSQHISSGPSSPVSPEEPETSSADAPKQVKLPEKTVVKGVKTPSTPRAKSPEVSIPSKNKKETTETPGTGAGLKGKSGNSSSPGCNEGFLYLDEGKVKECKTGLLWFKDLNLCTGIKNWPEAIDYIKGLNKDQALKWRLPTRDELKSLSMKLENHPDNPFANKKNGFYWTADTQGDDKAWIVYLFPYSFERVNKKNTTFCRFLPVCSIKDR